MPVRKVLDVGDKGTVIRIVMLSADIWPLSASYTRLRLYFTL